MGRRRARICKEDGLFEKIKNVGKNEFRKKNKVRFKGKAFWWEHGWKDFVEESFTCVEPLQNSIFEMGDLIGDILPDLGKLRSRFE